MRGWVVLYRNYRRRDLGGGEEALHFVRVAAGLLSQREKEWKRKTRGEGKRDNGQTGVQWRGG